MNTLTIRPARGTFALAALAVALLTAAPLAAQTYTLPASVVSSGGTNATGNGYTLRGTVGTVNGFASNATHTLGAGFWYQVPALEAGRSPFVEALAPLGLALQTPGPAPVVAGGPMLPFTVTMAIGPDGPSAFDYWAEVTLPDGRVVPVAGPSAALVTPGTTAALSIRQGVPRSAAPGGYTYTVRAGRYPDEVIAAGTVAFQVAAPAPMRYRRPMQEGVARDHRARERAVPSSTRSAVARTAAPPAADALAKADGRTAPADAAPAADDRWLAYDGAGRLLAPGTVTDLRTVADETVAEEERASATAGPPSLSGAEVPAEVALAAPYPNPAASRATLRFALPEAAPVRLALYDALGRRVALLADRPHEAGWHEAALDGRALAPGLYLARLEVGGAVRTQRLTLVR